MPPPPPYLTAINGPPSYGLPSYGHSQGAYGHPQAQPSFSQQPGYGQPQVQMAQGIMHMPDLPDTIEEWRASKPLLQSWLYLSVATMVTSLFMFWPGLLVGLLATIGASMHVCKCCMGGDPSLAGPVTTTYILAMVVVGIDSLICTLIALQTLIVLGTGCNSRMEHEDREDGFLEDEVAEDDDTPKAVKCIVLVAILTLTLIWYSVHCAISVRVMRKANRVRQWLNPISSGVVVL